MKEHDCRDGRRCFYCQHIDRIFTRNLDADATIEAIDEAWQRAQRARRLHRGHQQRRRAAKARRW